MAQANVLLQLLGQCPEVLSTSLHNCGLARGAVVHIARRAVGVSECDCLRLEA
jgi:hypothetical protein